MWTIFFFMWSLIFLYRRFILFHYKYIFIKIICDDFVSGFVSMQSIRGSTLSARRASEQCIQHASSVQSSLFSSTSLHHQQYSTHNSTSTNTSSTMVTHQQHVSSTRSFDTLKMLNVTGGFPSKNNDLENVNKRLIDEVVTEGDDERPELPIKTRLLQNDLFSR